MITEKVLTNVGDKTYVTPLSEMYRTQKFRTLQNGHDIFGRCTLDSPPPIKFNQPI